MSKVTAIAAALMISFSWLAISCMGPVFVHPPAAAATPAVSAAPAGTATTAGATAPGTGKLPVGALTPMNTTGTYLAIAIGMFFLLILCMIVFRGKAPRAY